MPKSFSKDEALTTSNAKSAAGKQPSVETPLGISLKKVTFLKVIPSPQDALYITIGPEERVRSTPSAQLRTTLQVISVSEFLAGSILEAML